MSNYSSEIMNIQIKRTVSEIMAEIDPMVGDLRLLCYKIGHRDARHAAADIAIRADAQIERLERERGEIETDDILKQEIQSLREQLKIALTIVKYYEPTVDVGKFYHDIGTCDYEQYAEDQRIRAENAETDRAALADALKKCSMKAGAIQLINDSTPAALASEIEGLADEAVANHGGQS